MEIRGIHRNHTFITISRIRPLCRMQGVSNAFSPTSSSAGTVRHKQKKGTPRLKMISLKIKDKLQVWDLVPSLSREMRLSLRPEKVEQRKGLKSPPSCQVLRPKPRNSEITDNLTTINRNYLQLLSSMGSGPIPFLDLWMLTSCSAAAKSRATRSADFCCPLELFVMYNLLIFSIIKL